MTHEKKYRNPLVTVDIIIELHDTKECENSFSQIVLIERKNPPHGWALPGGFVDYGESLEDSALREAKEETSLDIHLVEQFHTYSAPDRDPRHHTVTTVYIATAEGIPRAEDDAKHIGLFGENELPSRIAFDHGKIIHDYFRYKKGESKKSIF